MVMAVKLVGASGIFHVMLLLDAFVDDHNELVVFQDQALK